MDGSFVISEENRPFIRSKQALLVGLISCDTLGHVLLDVVVEELVVILMETGWSEEIFPFGDW